MSQAAGTPEGAHQVFGGRLPLAERYASQLTSSAVSWGLIGPREVPRIWERHILNCAAVQELIDEGESVVDIGSGAGLPGVAVAIARPDLRVTLVEPMQRRSEWLQRTIADLELSNVSVLRCRAEELDLQATVVTVRAVARMARLGEWSRPLLRRGGALLALKGQTIRTELDQDAAALRRAGAASWDVVTAGGGYLETPTTIARVVFRGRTKRFT